METSAIMASFGKTAVTDVKLGPELADAVVKGADVRKGGGIAGEV